MALRAFLQFHLKAGLFTRASEFTAPIVFHEGEEGSDARAFGRMNPVTYESRTRRLAPFRLPQFSACASQTRVGKRGDAAYPSRRCCARRIAWSARSSQRSSSPNSYSLRSSGGRGGEGGRTDAAVAELSFPAAVSSRDALGLPGRRPGRGRRGGAAVSRSGARCLRP